MGYVRGHDDIVVGQIVLGRFILIRWLAHEVINARFLFLSSFSGQKRRTPPPLVARPPKPLFSDHLKTTWSEILLRRYGWVRLW
jgi:hypothetical protein